MNHRPTENPKVKAIAGDGRNFLSQRRDLYDVIISQPSNPWITGVSNLFTREYFQSVKSRLADDGIFCQWAQLYEMAPWNIKAIYRTLAGEFPYVMVFAAEDLSSDTILIASRKPIELDIRKIARAFQNPITAAEAKRAGFDSPHDVPAFCCWARKSYARSSPVRSSTPTTMPSSSSRRRAISCVTRPTIPTWPRCTAPCGPMGT